MKIVLDKSYLDTCLVSNSLPVFDEKYCNFVRSEKYDYMLIVPKIKVNVSELIVNPVAKYILNLCNENNTIQFIYDSMKNRFKDADSNIILQDLIKTLYNFTRLEIVKWS